MRVKFYREHKYVSAALNDLERKIAKTDFRNDQEIEEVMHEWGEILEMLQGHAEYEEERLHTLLERRGSTIHLKAHAQHEEMDEALSQIEDLFQQALNETNEEIKVEVGYRLYLTYRKFVGQNLLHLHEEEMQILPELQRLYSDEELRQVERPTYLEMSPADIIDMLSTLFPHMNALDKEAFLEDIQLAVPAKYEQVISALPRR